MNWKSGLILLSLASLTAGVFADDDLRTGNSIGLSVSPTDNSKTASFINWGYRMYYLTGSTYPWGNVAEKTSVTAGVKSGEFDGWGGTAKNSTTEFTDEQIAGTPTTFSLGVSGVFAGGPGGSPISWNVNADTQFYYIKSNQSSGAKVVVVPTNTSVSFTAYKSSSSESSNWTISDGTNTIQKNNTASINFNRSALDVPSWFDTWVLDTPDPGVYSISAVSAAHSNMSDSGSLTVVGGQFTQGTNIPGWDEYTNWTGSYYGNPQSGRCSKPYASIKRENNGSVGLSLTPSPISKDVDLSTSLTITSPETKKTTASTTVSFPAATGDIDAKLGSDTLTSVGIYAYEQKNVSVLIVNVNGSSCAGDYSCFNQGIVNVTISGTVPYSCPVLYYGNNTYSIDGDMVWTEELLGALRDQFYATDYSRVSNVTKVQFFVPGKYLAPSGNPAPGVSEYISAKDSWIFPTYVRKNRTLPHELGHCLGLSHRNSDFYALMCQSAYAKGAAELLRQEEWDTLHP